MTKQQFIDWVDTMAVNGDCPIGHWKDNEWGGLTYVFDESLVKQKDIVYDKDKERKGNGFKQRRYKRYPSSIRLY